jgi:A/G-specific adenine glycosylase
VLARWFREHGRDLPWRRTTDAYAILVSEMMAQQTQVATVVPYYERWMVRFPTVTALAGASEAEVLSLWQGLGYYARARNLHRAARQVVQEHGGVMPRTVEALRALPGVGRYTAGAVASFAYDDAVPAVDANIARLLARLFDVRDPIDAEAGQSAIWEAAALLLPSRGGRMHTGALMELGALVCVPRRPRCEVCPVSTLCAADRPELLPVKRERRATVPLLEECAWVVSKRGILLERQEGPRWTGLWKLPPLGTPARAGELLWEEVYPFTHHRVTLRVYRADGTKGEGREWFAGDALREVALAAAHRRAVDGLGAAA